PSPSLSASHAPAQMCSLALVELSRRFGDDFLLSRVRRMTMIEFCAGLLQCGPCSISFSRRMIRTREPGKRPHAGRLMVLLVEREGPAQCGDRVGEIAPAVTQFTQQCPGTRLIVLECDGASELPLRLRQCTFFASFLRVAQQDDGVTDHPVQVIAASA